MPNDCNVNQKSELIWVLLIQSVTEGVTISWFYCNKGDQIYLFTGDMVSVLVYISVQVLDNDSEYFLVHELFFASAVKECFVAIFFPISVNNF